MEGCSPSAHSSALSVPSWVLLFLSSVSCPHRVFWDSVKTAKLFRLKPRRALKRYLSKLSLRRHTLKNRRISSFSPSSAVSGMVLTRSIVICSALACLISCDFYSNVAKKNQKNKGSCVQDSGSRESF